VIWSSPSRGCTGGREGERMARLHGRNCFIALEKERKKEKRKKKEICKGQTHGKKKEKEKEKEKKKE